nr:capsid protein [Torque teno virus]
MAWVPRSVWIRRRYGHFGGRSRTFRRRYYNRPWFSRRRGRSYRRRRALRSRRLRVRRKWLTIRQVNPTIRRKCVIKGWMPLLYCDRIMNFCRPMVIGTDLSTAVTGGWTLHEFSLNSFYAEHLVHRNLWSHTNCGFDLALYRGTSLTLFPHQTCDYMVWWDSDVTDIAEYKKLVLNVHPGILLNRKHARLVLSVETTRQYRPRKIHIPPPSTVRREWRTMKDWSTVKLGILAVVVIDFRYPWIHPHFAIRNEANQDNWNPGDDVFDIKRGTNQVDKVIKKGQDFTGLDKTWWNAKGDGGKATAWVDYYPAWTSNTSGQQPIDTTNDRHWAVLYGPFVKKLHFADCQLIATYRSHWTWGGDVLTRDETVCDPQTYNPKARSRREVLDPRFYITPDDIRKDGYIRPEVFRRIAAAPSAKAGFTNFAGKESSSEETSDQEIGALPNDWTEDEDSPSPKRPRLSRRRVDGGRIEELQRLRYLLNHFWQGKRAYSV